MKKLFILFAAGSLLSFTTSCQESSNESESAVASAPAGSSAAATSEVAASPLPERNPTAPRPPKYQAEAEAMESTTVEFAGEIFDFGEVPEGTKVSHQFMFTNTGDHPLKLTRVKASCGCTTPRYSDQAIAPGEQGYIDVEFDSSGKPGHQNKSVTVTGNFSDGVNKIPPDQRAGKAGRSVKQPIIFLYLTDKGSVHHYLPLSVNLF